MTKAVRIAYLLALGALVVAGYFFIEAPWWILAVIAVAVMVPVVAADIITSTRRRPTSASG